MITDALLQFALAGLEFFWNLLPEWELQLPENFWHITAQFMRWNVIAPISEAQTIFGVTAGAFAAMLAVKVVVKLVDWVTNIIP